MKSFLWLVLFCVFTASIMSSGELRAEPPASSSYVLAAWGWNQRGCSHDTARSSSSYSLLDSMGPPMISMGTDGLPYFAGSSTRCYMDVLFCAMSAMPTPAEMRLNGSSFARDDFFSATFQLNRSITQPFTVYAVVIMPNGFMLDALTLGSKLKPIVSNYPGLNAPFSYPFISLKLPQGAPLGQYEVVAAFFDTSKPRIQLLDDECQRFLLYPKHEPEERRVFVSQVGQGRVVVKLSHNCPGVEGAKLRQ